MSTVARPQRLAGDARPMVSSRFRLQWEEAQQAWVLLYPEGMVRLNGSAGEIMKRCDGARSVDELVAELEQVFDARGLRAEIVGFLEFALGQHWIVV